MATQRAKEDGWQVFFLLSFKSYKEINVWTAERITTTRAHTHTQSRELKRYPIIFRLLNWVFDRRSKTPFDSHFDSYPYPLYFLFIFFFAPFYFWGCSSPRSASKRKRGDQSNWLRLFMPLVPHSFWGYRSACGTHPSIYIFYSTYISTSFYHDTANVVERVTPSLKCDATVLTAKTFIQDTFLRRNGDFWPSIFGAVPSIVFQTWVLEAFANSSSCYSPYRAGRNIIRRLIGWCIVFFLAHYAAIPDDIPTSIYRTSQQRPKDDTQNNGPDYTALFDRAIYRAGRHPILEFLFCI